LGCALYVVYALSVGKYGNCFFINMSNERKKVVVCVEKEDEDHVKVKLENVAEEYVVGCVSLSDWKRKEAKLKSGVLTELQMKGERREEIKNMKNVNLKGKRSYNSLVHITVS